MSNYTFQIPVGTSQRTYTAVIDTTTFYTYNDNYKTDPQIRFEFDEDILFQARLDRGFCYSSSVWFTGAVYDGRHAMSVEDMISSGKIRCFSDDQSTSYINTKYHETGGFDSWGDPWQTDTQYLPYYCYGWTAAEVVDINTWVLSTNIPIFETTVEMNEYLLHGTGITNAVNYDVPAVEKSEDFQISCVWTHGTVAASGITPGSALNYRLVRGKIAEGGKISLYKIAGLSDGALKYGLTINGRILNVQYSTDGNTWINSDTFPYSFFYRQPEDGDPYGTYDFAVSFYSYFPSWDTKEDSDLYIEGDKDISEATNWPLISSHYPYHNTTGSDLGASVFGEVKVKGYFTQQYICDDTCLAAIANALFDTSAAGLWEDFKKGLEAWGASPIEAVMGLSFWPFDVSTVFTATSAQYIWFGGYGWETPSGHCSQIMYPNGYKSIGSLKIEPSFGGSFRDYEPYSKLYVVIPYCGTYQLDIARYLGKTVEVRYYIDTRTNGCICCLIADGYLTDYFNGQMGCTMPITLTDYSAYMNAQMQVLLQGGGQAVSSFGSAAGTVGSLAPLGNAGMLAGGAVSAGAAAISGAAIGAKTVYGLSQNNINNFNKTKGGSSSMINCYLPQTVDFIFEIQDDCTPSNFAEMLGSPSMVGGRVGEFSGFLKCQSVKVNAGKATEREKERIKQMLLSGIYI